MKKTISILLVLVALAALLVPVSAGNLSEKQEAIQRTALAYYYRGHGVQYDSDPITAYAKYSGGPIRGGYTFSPEDATADNLCYSVCSDYTLEVYYDAFGWVFMDNILNCKTANIMDLKEDDPMVVYRYDKADPAYAGITMEQNRARARELFQVGDVYVSEGHAMLYAGDILGDGHDYIIHCYGKKYDFTKGTDNVEDKTTQPKGNGGAIRLDALEDSVFNEAGKMYSLFKERSFIIVRPLNVLGSTPLTESAKARMKYEGLDIDRVADHSRYKDVAQGDDVTVTLTLTNYSKSAYTVPVTQLVPANATLKKADGAKVDGSKLTWSVELKPEEPKVLTYTVTATGKRGDIIDLTGGNVAGIRDNDIPVTIGGKRLTAEQNEKLLHLEDYKTEINAKGLSGVELATAVYQDILGLDVTFQRMNQYVKELCQAEKVPNVGNMYRFAASVAPEFARDSAMRIPHYYGGYYVLTDDSSDRILDFDSRHLIPGDVIVLSVAGTSNLCYVYLGENQVAYLESKKLRTRKADEVLLRNLTYDYFIGLRPTLAYDDINAEAKYVPQVRLPFTDVKEADWFYSFVKELYTAGVVSGMTETTFVPNGQLTYGQALKLIVCGLGKGEQPAGAHWASGYLSYAKNQKWLDKDVDLNANISRLSFCQIAAKAKGLTAQPAANPFTDCADPDVLALVNAGIINGMTATTFAPDSVLTRAQITKIISGLIK